MSEKRYALLIGSSEFPKEPGLPALRCALNDVRGFAEALQSSQPPFTQVKVLENSSHHEVLGELEALLADMGGDDMLVLYYSGHGKVDDLGRLRLATHNTSNRLIKSTSISIEDVGEMLGAQPSVRTLMIMDCCYSGAAGKDLFKGDVDSGLRQLASGSGRFLITASSSLQLAREKAGDVNSVFTKHLIEAWKGKAADPDDGTITVDGLYRYVHDEVVKESSQEPTKHASDVRGEFVLARVAQASRELRREAAKPALETLWKAGYIDDDVYGEALALLSRASDEMTPSESKREALVTDLVGGKLKVGSFLKGWYRLRDRAEERVEPPRKSGRIEPPPEPPRAEPPRREPVRPVQPAPAASGPAFVPEGLKRVSIWFVLVVACFVLARGTFFFGQFTYLVVVMVPIGLAVRNVIRHRERIGGVEQAIYWLVSSTAFVYTFPMLSWAVGVNVFGEDTYMLAENGFLIASIPVSLLLAQRVFARRHTGSGAELTLYTVGASAALLPVWVGAAHRGEDEMALASCLSLATCTLVILGFIQRRRGRSRLVAR